MNLIEKIDELIEATSEKAIEKKMLKQGKKYKITLPKGKGKPLYTDSFNAAKEMVKEYGKGTKVEDMSKNLTWHHGMM